MYKQTHHLTTSNRKDTTDLLYNTRGTLLQESYRIKYIVHFTSHKTAKDTLENYTNMATTKQEESILQQLQKEASSGQHWQKYKKLKLLGRGFSGEVYLGKTICGDQDVGGGAATEE